jgi:hypothetical protein
VIDRYVGKTRIVLQGRGGDDALILGICAYALLILGVMVVLVFRSPERSWGVIAFLVLSMAIMVWMSRGPIARLDDKRPWLIADTEGLRLHPTLAPRTLPWSTIHAVLVQESTSNSRRQILVCVRLRQPVRSLMSPWGAIEISIGAGQLGLTKDSADNLVRQLELLRQGRGSERAAAI